MSKRRVDFVEGMGTDSWQSLTTTGRFWLYIGNLLSHFWGFGKMRRSFSFVYLEYQKKIRVSNHYGLKKTSLSTFKFLIMK